MSTSRNILVAIALAAKDMGILEIWYPVFQAFAYYLKRKNQLFPDYLFNGIAWPGKESETIEFPQSVELLEDLNRLVSSGLLKEVPNHIYVLTSSAESLRDRYIKKLEATGLTFDDLRRLADALLRGPERAPEPILEHSYQLWINQLGSLVVVS